jgi:hypothetical protein
MSFLLHPVIIFLIVIVVGSGFVALVEWISEKTKP